MKIIFDATTLLPIASKTSSRSGIFFSAFSLLREFEKTHEVILYVDYRASHIVQNDPLLSRYPRIEPRGYWDRKISWIYRTRLSLDARRKNPLIRLFCRFISLLTLCLDGVCGDRLRSCRDAGGGGIMSSFRLIIREGVA